MSVIARTAFAADVNAFDDEEAPILQNSKELFDIFRSKGSISLLFMLLCPNLATTIEKYTDYTFFANKQNKFFKEVLNELFEQRQMDPEASKVIHMIFI
uniref:Uncharacterized protein n=1 Tax=Acrobeloides nanus TaxID=290746 RepID=A0A914DJ21_9BILA